MTEGELIRQRALHLVEQGGLVQAHPARRYVKLLVAMAVAAPTGVFLFWMFG